MHQAYAGALHQVARFRRAVGNGDALPEIGGALRFTGLNTRQVAFGNQAIVFEGRAKHGQGGLLVGSALAHADLLRVEFEHRVLLTGVRACRRWGGYPLVR